MKRVNSLEQISRIMLLAILPSLVVYVIILYLSISDGIDPILVLRDPIQSCDYPTVVGMISNLGVLMWASATSITLFASFSGLVEQIKWRVFLYFGSFLSGFLCLDDLFLLHDRHVGQNFIYTTYAIFALFILFRFYKLILQSYPLPFLVSTSLLGLSILSDKFQESLFISYSTMQLYEEGFKFVGIATWLFFWVNISIYAIDQKAKIN